MGTTTLFNRFKELDALRGIAALMVVFFHFTMGRNEASLGFKLGTTGVDLFFIISGFVIYMSLDRIKSSSEFIINRVSRLYPTYWACVTLTFIFITLQTQYLNGGAGPIDFKPYLGNMTMFQFYLNIPDLDGPYWTMIIEMIFYIGILFLFHFKLIKYLNIIGLSLTVAVVLATSFWGEKLQVMHIIKWVPLLQFIPLFFAGTIFYKIYTEKSKLLERYALILICLISQILLYRYAGRSRDFVSQNEYATMLMIYFALFTLFVNNKLSFIVSKWTLFLGKISFALYLIHQFISIKVIIPYFTDTLHINFWIASLLVALPTVILLASLVTFLIEIPLGKRMKAKLRSATGLE